MKRIKEGIEKIITVCLGLILACLTINEVLYEYYISRGMKLSAWRVRPIYSFKIWLKRKIISD